MENVSEINQKKVEALREKWVAAVLMQSENYIEARYKLCNAQQLYPELDNIDSMLTVCDILISVASIKSLRCKIDYCWVLELIMPSLTYSEARCHYEKLVTLFQPIEDEFPGTELALEHVMNALSVLSDREKQFHCHAKGIPSSQILSGGNREGLSTEVLSESSTDYHDIAKQDDIISIEVTSLEETRCRNFKSYPEDKVLKPSWCSSDFASGQIWAVYCGKDFLPRQYARIDYVISESQVCVTFLEPLPILDHENDCNVENLPVVCGIYKVSGSSINLEMSQFSYLVKFQKGTGIYKIYPLKGEIWAMYNNWNSMWKHNDYESDQCQIVQILSDFSDGDNITITRLEEVKGCLTFFHRQQFDGFDMIRGVSEAEMLGFSHQIPAFRVPGIGRYGIPESSWHLEPNALTPKQRNRFQEISLTSHCTV